MNWKNLKINIPVRMKNFWFWVSLGSVILTAMGISAEMLTSWEAVGQAFSDLINNPYMLGCVIMNLIGVVNDPTTSGLTDSEQAMTYDKPKEG